MTAVDTTDTAAQSTSRRRGEAAWVWTAIVTVVAAGLLHLATASEHVGHNGLLVGFFLLVAAGQVAGAAWLFLSSRPGLRTPPALIVTGLVGTVVLIGLYFVAYQTDLLPGFVGDALNSAGQHAGHTTGTALPTNGLIVSASPNLLAFATVAVEVVSVVALTALLPRTWRRRAVDILCALGALAWLLWLTGVLS